MQRLRRLANVTLRSGHLSRKRWGNFRNMNIEETVELLQSTVRVLVVDDVELWQTFVHMHLDKEPNLHVIGVAADGLEAVRKAEEQLPDLILLGVSLPKLNGLEAARQIREPLRRALALPSSDREEPRA